jgi:hypothetical protein
MAKLKRFSFSSKPKSSQPDAAAPATAAAAAAAAAAPVSTSLWLGGAPPLIFDDHVGSNSTPAAAAAAAAGNCDAETIDENGAEWNCEEEARGLDIAPDQLEDLRSSRGGDEGGTGSGEDGGDGKVVVRGCIGDVSVVVVDDSNGGGRQCGCSVEVRGCWDVITALSIRAVYVCFCVFIKRHRRACRLRWAFCSGMLATLPLQLLLVRCMSHLSLHT